MQWRGAAVGGAGRSWVVVSALVVIRDCCIQPTPHPEGPRFSGAYVPASLWRAQARAPSNLSDKAAARAGAPVPDATPLGGVGSKRLRSLLAPVAANAAAAAAAVTASGSGLVLGETDSTLNGKRARSLRTGSSAGRGMPHGTLPPP
jgi:hypothetical protein